jgi:hypothetical protein
VWLNLLGANIPHVGYEVLVEDSIYVGKIKTFDNILRVKLSMFHLKMKTEFSL